MKHAIAPFVLVSLLAAAACSDDGSSDDDSAGVAVVLAGEPFPDERCEANRAAGTINYFTGFNFAAAASMTEVFVADAKGYYDDMCLDVVITPSFSVPNLALVAAGEVQFSTAGSFAELVDWASDNDADLVALSVAGHVAIDVLMVKPDRADSLADLADQTIGVKGALPPAIAVLLNQEADLVEGTDFETAQLDGFDPNAHWAIDELSALPGWRSNEPGALERAGVEFDLYDPGDFGIPGSFGLIYTSRAFLDEHRSAAEDFMRASMLGLADAIADPVEAAQIAIDLAEANGNPGFQTLEGEEFRWTVDAETIVSSTPDGVEVGVPVVEEFADQVDAYAETGFFGDGDTPGVDEYVDADLVAGLYDDEGQVIWPG